MSAQDDGCVVDPYSGGEECPDSPPKCSLDQEVIDDGRRVHVRGSGFIPDQDITGLFDGEVVFTLHTDDGTFDVTFDIPARPPGTYNVVIRGSTGQECDPPVVIADDGTVVLGTTFTRGGAGATGGSVVARPAVGGRGVNGGGLSGLARTGIAVAVLVAVAVVLLVAGGAARVAARRR